MHRPCVHAPPAPSGLPVRAAASAVLYGYNLRLWSRYFSAGAPPGRGWRQALPARCARCGCSAVLCGYDAGARGRAWRCGYCRSCWRPPCSLLAAEEAAVGAAGAAAGRQPPIRRHRTPTTRYRRRGQNRRCRGRGQHPRPHRRRRRHRYRPRRRRPRPRRPPLSPAPPPTPAPRSHSPPSPTSNSGRPGRSTK